MVAEHCRGRIQGAEVAYSKLAQTMNEFSSSRLWGQRYSWLAGSVQGFDIIGDSMFVLYGQLLGALNIRTSLFGGVEVLGPAASELEGANFTFGLGGRDVTVGVKDGIARVW